MKQIKDFGFLLSGNSFKILTNNLFSSNSNSSSWGSSNNSWGSSNNSVGVGSNNWGMVDHMLGGVVGNMLLDRDLGNVLDLMVDLVANMVDNWGSGNSNWCSMDSSNWGSMDSSNSWGSMVGSNWGSMDSSNWGSMDSSNSWGSIDSDSWGSSSNCGYWGSSSNSSITKTKSKTVAMGTKENLGISISSWGSIAASNTQEDSLKYCVTLQFVLFSCK